MKCSILQHVSVINFQNRYCNYSIWNPQIQAFQGDIFLGQKLKEIQSLLFSCVRQHPTFSTSKNHKKPRLTLCSPSQQCKGYITITNHFRVEINRSLIMQWPCMNLVILHIQTNTKDLRMLNIVKGKKCLFQVYSFCILVLFEYKQNQVTTCEQRFLCMAFIVYKVVCMMTCLSCIVALFMPREDRNQLHENY